MNHLKVRTRLDPEPDTPEDGAITEVLVDRQLLVDFVGCWLAVDLMALEHSIHNDGEHFIVTCSCGEASCAGIKEGIHVSRSTGNIHWVMRGFGETRTFYFEPEQYKSAIRNGIRQFQELIKAHRIDYFNVAPLSNYNIYIRKD